MKTIIFATIFGLMMFVTVSAQSEKKKMTIEKDIRAVLNKQVDAWNKGDIDGFMKGYWKSEKMVFISGQSVSRGWQAALDRYKKSYNSREKMGTLLFSELEIDVLSKESALVVGRFTLERKKDKPTGIFTLTFKRIAGAWKIIADHTS